MKELIELLRPEEKRRLSYLLLALCVAVFFLWYFSFGQRTRFREAQDSLASSRKAFAELKTFPRSKEAEARRWEEARAISRNRTKRFYGGSEGSRDARISRNFSPRPESVRRLSFEYADLGKEGLRKSSSASISRPLTSIKGSWRRHVPSGFGRLEIDFAVRKPNRSPRIESHAGGLL